MSNIPIKMNSKDTDRTLWWALRVETLLAAPSTIFSSTSLPVSNLTATRKHMSLWHRGWESPCPLLLVSCWLVYPFFRKKPILSKNSIHEIEKSYNCLTGICYHRDSKARQVNTIGGPRNTIQPIITNNQSILSSCQESVLGLWVETWDEIQLKVALTGRSLGVWKWSSWPTV